MISATSDKKNKKYKALRKGFLCCRSQIADSVVERDTGTMMALYNVIEINHNKHDNVTLLFNFHRGDVKKINEKLVSFKTNLVSLYSSCSLIDPREPKK